MDLSVSEWMKSARVTLPCALAWRAMTELVRRRHAGWDFAIEQFHPGISARGAYGLWLRDSPSGAPATQINFYLGGPSGTWSTGMPESTGNLSDLLLPEPARVIDQIEQVAGIPRAPSPVPPSTQGVLGMRLGASVLEALVFRPVPWRVTLGACGHGGGTTIADWVHHFGVEGLEREPCDDTLKRLGDCLLIHAAPYDEPAMAQEKLAGNGLTIDLASGVIGRMDTTGWEKVHQLGNSTGFPAASLCQLAARLVGHLR